ncbi:MAG: hypothetical protein V4580_16285 [Bacteroidota bacterium]
MQEEQPRRKPRIPLSPEELYYFKQIKHLKELKQIEDLKKTPFYKIINNINITLAAFLSYCLLSILICCHWQKTYVSSINCSYGEFNRTQNARTVTELQITAIDGTFVPVKTAELYQLPEHFEGFYIGRDFLFNKILKAKLGFDDRTFWHIYTYPSFMVIVFALCMGFFVYRVNKHLSVNGLLTVCGLFFLASLYFVMV